MCDYESHSVVNTYSRSICVDSDGFLYVGCNSEVLCY